MNIAFRTDASRTIGTGHVMRCLTLAEKIKSRFKQTDVRIRFVSRHMPTYLQEMMKARHFELVMLQTSDNPSQCDDLAHAAWLGTGQQVDVEATYAVLDDLPWQWLIVDHYALDARWERDIRSSSEAIMVIDDIADREHDCELLLDQNYYPDIQTRYAKRLPEDCKSLLGPKFAMLRDEFGQWRSRIKPRTGTVKKLLVFFGGGDTDNVTGQVVEVLSDMRLSGMQVDVIIGAQHGHRNQIESSCEQYGFQCHVQTPYMASFMAEADLAIGAAGSASWERCCLGLPAILVSLAENQVDIAQGVEQLGAGRYLGRHNEIADSDWETAIQEFITTADKVRECSERAWAVVDGLGVDRVCDALQT